MGSLQNLTLAIQQDISEQGYFPDPREAEVSGVQTSEEVDSSSQTSPPLASCPQRLESLAIGVCALR